MSRPVSSNPIDRIVYGIVDAPETLRKAVDRRRTHRGPLDVVRSAARLPRVVVDKVSWAWLGKHV